MAVNKYYTNKYYTCGKLQMFTDRFCIGELTFYNTCIIGKSFEQIQKNFFLYRSLNVKLYFQSATYIPIIKESKNGSSFRFYYSIDHIEIGNG